MSTSQPPAGHQPLTPATRKRLDKCFEYATKQAAQDNFDYATDLFSQCILGDPGKLEYVRGYMENLHKKYGNNKRGASLGQLKEMGSRSALKKAVADSKWEEVVKHGLKVLTVNPWDIHTLRSLALAMQNLSPLGEAEMYYLKCALEANSKDPETNKQCANAAADRGQYEMAIACWHRVELAQPGDRDEAQKAISDLSVRRTLTSLESKKAAAKSAQPGAAQQEEATPEELARQRVAANPKDLMAYYELAQIYLNSDRFKEAEQAYADAFEASDGDPDVKEKWQDVQVRRLRHQATIAQTKRKDSEAAEAEFRRLRKELNDKELEVCLYRVERYPTILRYKYELALRYQIGKQFNEAIKQFQQARNDPRVRGVCLLGLAQCFQSIKQPRLAKRHFEEAIAEIPDRDGDNKKKALYQAGKLALSEKDLDTAEKHLAALAGMDFTYEDVSALLDKVAELRDNEGSQAAS